MKTSLGVRQRPHVAFPGNIDFTADDLGALSCCVDEGLMCLFIVCETMFTIGESCDQEQFAMQMTQNSKHNKWLEILAGEDFPPKLLWRTPTKIHRERRRRRQQEIAKEREHRLAQRRQHHQHSDHKHEQRQRQNITITL